MLKAYVVYNREWSRAGAFLVAAPTDAAARAWARSDFDTDYIDMRAVRRPAADRFIDPTWDRITDMTLNVEATKAAGFTDITDEE
jgi:hypothetical protein